MQVIPVSLSFRVLGALCFNDSYERVVGIHPPARNKYFVTCSEKWAYMVVDTYLYGKQPRVWIRSMIDKYGIKGWYIDRRRTVTTMMKIISALKM